jgi:hypothetical protein|tara:strand:- start:11 stop:379 length:369 start_codon:yes stop_codon:yes gene_type:complete
MAYLHKNDLVIIRTGTGETIQSRVVDISFRRYRKKVRDRKTGKEKMVTKAMPYAVCNVFLGAKVGTEFLIPGYKLRNEEKNSEKLLVLKDEYATEFDDGFSLWVAKMLAESKQKREKKQNNP